MIASTSGCHTWYFAPGACSLPLDAFSCCAPAFVLTTVSTRSLGSMLLPRIRLDERANPSVYRRARGRAASN